MRLNRMIAREARSPQPGHNICGVLLHADPAHLLSVADALAHMPGVEVHERGDDGRMVVVVEDTPEITAVETLSRLQTVPGVAAASLVYHHCDQESPEHETTRRQEENTP